MEELWRYPNKVPKTELRSFTGLLSTVQLVLQNAVGRATVDARRRSCIPTEQHTIAVAAHIRNADGRTTTAELPLASPAPLVTHIRWLIPPGSVVGWGFPHDTSLTARSLNRSLAFDLSARAVRLGFALSFYLPPAINPRITVYAIYLFANSLARCHEK